ncbi:hypothetical protein AA313_de0200934 [Arthrobotrys entomopaga]|nr:hypothetical protein AA313_de0200934 [Arthrobotrys entomopaga]
MPFALNFQLFLALTLLVPFISAAPVNRPSTSKLERRNLIGNNVGVIDIASQNSANNNGNTAGSASHSSGTQNTAQQLTTDAQSIDVIKNIEVLENPLIIV